ncbi:thioredoxin domain-containing protein [soil metagenome]
MANRLGDAISPYLRSHADNPVDWYPWGEAAFAEAARRDVPVLVSIGYSTCHWCHVMARESFSDPDLAAVLNRGFVAVKVDREEHPEVDAVYLAAAGAFTQNLGWPLNVFVTPDAKPFFAGTYSPPVAAAGNPSFGQVLGAVSDAWANRRDDIESTASQLTVALVAAANGEHSGENDGELDDERGDERTAEHDDEHRDDEHDVERRGEPGGRHDGEVMGGALPTPAQLAQVVFELDAYEDTLHGGFGGAPKFPVAPVLKFLQAMDAPLADRALRAMAASPLRDRVEGGFFRYATAADWSEPHYERMLYDNALLLDAYTTAAQERAAQERAGQPVAGQSATGAQEERTSRAQGWAAETAAGIASFLIGTMQIDGGGFASAQDSESVVGGRQSEGGYYALDAGARAGEVPPKLDLKVLTGWNGLAISALAHAGEAFGNMSWLDAASAATDYLLDHHFRADGSLVRASLGGELSHARATLEDFGMFADALLRLGAVQGSQRYLRVGRQLVDDAMRAGAGAGEGVGAAAPVGSIGSARRSPVFAAPGGGDPVLAAHGLLIEGDVSEGAYPSGLSAMSSAACAVYFASGDSFYIEAARSALASVAAGALERPIGFGAALEIMAKLAAVGPADQAGAIGPAHPQASAASGSATHSFREPS